MLLNNSSASEATEQDIVMKLSLPKDIKLNDWHRHAEISEMGYRLGREWLQTQNENTVLKSFREPLMGVRTEFFSQHNK